MSSVAWLSQIPWNCDTWVIVRHYVAVNNQTMGPLYDKQAFLIRSYLSSPSLFLKSMWVWIFFFLCWLAICTSSWLRSLVGCLSHVVTQLFFSTPFSWLGFQSSLHSLDDNPVSSMWSTNVLSQFVLPSLLDKIFAEWASLFLAKFNLSVTSL